MSYQEQAPTQVAAPDTADEHDRTLAPSRLLLVRHGESTWNADRRIQGQLDPPLTERGLAQAQEVAERFTGHRLERLYCSDLVRARQTAEVIGAAVGLEPVLEPGLREIALGAWEGRTREELMEEYPELWERWSREPDWDIVPGGEGAAPFARRVNATLARLRERHPAGDVLCVSHGGVIQVAVLDVVGRASRGMFPFLIENCSMTVIQRTARRTVVTAVNDTCHLS
jgi:2,3-bisphosphoglycerate-dependent phosphoglycerate mutase